MSRRVRFARTAAALALVTLVASCGSGGAATGIPVADGELRLAAQFVPRSGYAMDTDDAYGLYQLGVTETLVAAGSDGRVRPGLATDWTPVDDRTWRFTLRPGVTFQDGTPLTPEAVATALGWVAGVAAPPRAVKGIGLTAAADGTGAVRVSTAKPDPILPLRLSSVNTAILAPSAYEPGTPPSVRGTGTGPMRLVEAEGNRTARLERNDSYWGGRAQLARVAVQYVTDPTARALALRAGDVDIAQGLPESSLLEFTGPNGYDNQTVPAPRTASLLLNLSAKPFDDLRARQAVAKAIDRTALAEQALAGSATPASELFGGAVPFGSTDAPAPADPAGARALLEQAGYGPQNPLRVRLATYPNRAELPTLATAVQGMLREVGIDAQIRVAEYAPQEAQILAGDFDMFVLSRSYLTDVPDAGATLSSDYSCAGSYNVNHYCSAEFDALIGPLSTSTDPLARQAIFRQAARKLVDDVAGVPLIHSQENGVARGVSGYTVDPLGKRLVTTGLTRTSS
ncbi:ABC transporter substrate-binding protein [Pseudonocardia ailaonensis]|uniref:ABC transporter substrate-binding protein n=1 Tax=Pseudonocardia ailaonensis TaxID=367279 RepID=A0ABN2MJB5_9PSEU